MISGGCIKSEKGFAWIFDTSGSMRAVLWNLARITVTPFFFGGGGCLCLVCVCVYVCLDVDLDM